MIGHLNSFSASGGGNLNKNFAKNTNAPGLPGGGCWSFDLTGTIWRKSVSPTARLLRFLTFAALLNFDIGTFLLVLCFALVFWWTEAVWPRFNICPVSAAIWRTIHHILPDMASIVSLPESLKHGGGVVVTCQSSTKLLIKTSARQVIRLSSPLICPTNDFSV